MFGVVKYGIIIIEIQVQRRSGQAQSSSNKLICACPTTYHLHFYTPPYLQLDIHAKQLVPVPVEDAVLMAAVPALAASGALHQGRQVLVRRAGVAGRVVTALGVLA